MPSASTQARVLLWDPVKFFTCSVLLVCYWRRGFERGMQTRRMERENRDPFELLRVERRGKKMVRVMVLFAGGSFLSLFLPTQQKNVSCPSWSAWSLGLFFWRRMCVALAVQSLSSNGSLCECWACLSLCVKALNSLIRAFNTHSNHAGGRKNERSITSVKHFGSGTSVTRESCSNRCEPFSE